ncbi:YesL family protein [Thermobacillus sp. ZCTH02-B1]|uniref:YesL family protein n=1 Tax=Thermobacillus sp. ZCTH02-B1 TaxID=1858795 RepID=UPI0025EA72D4|nr:DUF624 domain-containing protein [Thermobacillus sp. ZCTH02-B1]
MEMRGMMGGFYKLSEWIMRLSVTNLLWVLMTLPFWFLFYTFFLVPSANVEDTEQLMSQLYFGLVVCAALLPFVVFPATAAMFTTVRKWVMGDVDVPLIKTFFRGYRENYKSAMFGGLLYTLMFVIIILDIRFYLRGAPGIELISYIFMGIAALLFVSLFNFFSMIVHYHMKTIDLLKNAVFITIGRPIRSLSSAIAAGGVFWISTKFTFLFPFFTFVIIAYLSFLNFYQIYLKLKEQHERQELERQEEERREQQEPGAGEKRHDGEDRPEPAEQPGPERTEPETAGGAEEKAEEAKK